MKEHPILFSAPMVKAIISGKKTQTSLVIRALQFTGSSACVQGFWQGAPDGWWPFFSYDWGAIDDGNGVERAMEALMELQEIVSG